VKRLRNSSGIPDDTVRQVVDFIATELGIAGFDVECRKCSSTLAGRAYSQGSSYHSSARPFVVLRIGTEQIVRWTAPNAKGRPSFASRRWHLTGKEVAVKVTTERYPTTIRLYQYAHHKNKKYVLGNRIEALVYLAAHELRHLWQAASATDKRKSAALPRYYGSKGKFSEVDTEAYAVHTLRRWRRHYEKVTTPRHYQGGTGCGRPKIVLDNQEFPC